jgi:hypothetical protein
MSDPENAPRYFAPHFVHLGRNRSRGLIGGVSLDNPPRQPRLTGGGVSKGGRLGERLNSTRFWAFARRSGGIDGSAEQVP